MSYQAWFIKHGIKHKEIMAKLEKLGDDEVIEYFKFENMVQREKKFCPLYAQNRKCHNIEDLNCYLCACPNFRFNDNGFEKKIDGRIVLSRCNIGSKYGKEFKSKIAVHWDCSNCTIPHNEQYIKTVFSRDWFKIMKKTLIVK